MALLSMLVNILMFYYPIFKLRKANIIITGAKEREEAQDRARGFECGWEDQHRQPIHEKSILEPLY